MWREKRPASYVDGPRDAVGGVLVDVGALLVDQSLNLRGGEARGFGEAADRMPVPGRPGVLHQSPEQLTVMDAQPGSSHGSVPSFIPIRGWG